ncbi:52 kDa repressor of the inhibitor of the protein kinase-like [Dysidea avara]|uniref:52 kDa repressor of the inhibitor of the protein kinase-like n=1 Tax=Dysidea avara TaxID=196820 RepID=UPI00331AB745
MENIDARIDFQLNTANSKTAAENRLKLRSIAETVIFCGRQGLAFHGHRDDRPSVEENPNNNHGNFLGLLKFRVQAGDKVHSNHLESAAGNAIYTSKTIQNDLVSICGDLIRNKILEKIRHACYFSVLADEATDVANDEQLSISIRYVDEGSPTEVFMGFHKCVSGVTGQAIANDILSQLEKWQLQLPFLRGQAYDGAGAMAGKSKGAAACITAKHPKALYTHCASHRLNLCVVKSCTIREISNMMQSADKVSRFFSNSPKRQLALEKWIDNLFANEKRRKIKEMCRTHWIERHEAFESFMDLFMPIVCCLEEIANSSPVEWNAETRSDAQSLFFTVFRFLFVIALVATQNVLSYIKGLSLKLQGCYVNAIWAHRDIQNVKSTLVKQRCDVERFHLQIYNEVTVLCQSVGIEESVPRVTNRQQNRQNLPSDSPSEYYKRTTIRMLDHLISELNVRFTECSSQFLLQFAQLLPSELIKNLTKTKNIDFDDLIKFYEDDLPLSRGFSTELELWRNYWSSETCKADAEALNTPEKALKQHDKDLYPNIYTLLTFAATVPVTSCECERSISMLRLIKTSLRSTMTQERLNGLAMMQYHHQIPLEADEVVEEFATRQPRKLLL